MTSSPSISRIVAPLRRRAARLLLGSVVCALALAVTCGLASAVSSTASSGKVSAHLTKTSFTGSQAGSVKLVCKFSKKSGSFSYVLTFKKGSKWQAVKSVSKKSYSKSSYTMTAKQVFRGKSVKVGSYRLKLSANGGSKLLSFKVVKGSSGGGSTGGDGSTGGNTTRTGSDPTNTALPTISGTTVEGQTLTASNGSWNNSPSSYAYHWLRCKASDPCMDISSVTASSYVLQAADVTYAIRVRVTATNSFGSTNARSDPTGIVTTLSPTNLALPTIRVSSWGVQESRGLQALNGTWANSPTSYRYQWLRCGPSGDGCSGIPASNPEYPNYYDLTGSDVASTIRVSVTASNAFGSTTATSNPTIVVIPLPPENVVLPTILGTAMVGQTLTVDTGTWNHSPTGFNYQWQDCDRYTPGNCNDIGTERSPSHVVQAYDVNHTIQVVVTAINAGGFVSANSNPTDVVPSS